MAVPGTLNEPGPIRTRQVLLVRHWRDLVEESGWQAMRNPDVYLLEGARERRYRFRRQE